jgi:taurine dioxygenase
MSESIGEDGLVWRGLKPFGVEVDHDLSAPLSEPQARRLVGLLWENGLILARGQRLSMERQQDLCALAGPILLRQGETGFIAADPDIEATVTELSWHSDAAYTRAPLDVISLYAVEVADEASSTRFVSAQDALDKLPPALRERLEGRSVEMISPSMDALGGRTCDQPDPPAMKRGRMPAIYRNPHNGRDCVWVSELQASRILGLDWEESRDLLHAVFDHLYQPAHVLEHRWRNGDLIIWDNVALQHMRGSLRDCGVRILQRAIVGMEGVTPNIPSPEDHEPA